MSKEEKLEGSNLFDFVNGTGFRKTSETDKSPAQ
jgi:hypothetical protein